MIDKMTIDELVESVAAGTDSLKIKRKNGRTLTTLVKTEGKWLADTLWFEVACGHRNPELRTPLGTAERAAPWPS